MPRNTVLCGIPGVGGSPSFASPPASISSLAFLLRESRAWYAMSNTFLYGPCGTTGCSRSLRPPPRVSTRPARHRRERREDACRLPGRRAAELRLLDRQAEDVLLHVRPHELPAREARAHALREAAQAAVALQEGVALAGRGAQDAGAGSERHCSRVRALGSRRVFVLAEGAAITGRHLDNARYDKKAYSSARYKV